jgi:hypothetical protein
MAIPASGAISMSMLATEFSSSQTTNISLFGLASKLSTPVTSNIFEAASFYGQSLPVSLTSFNYNRNAQEEYEEACALESTEDVAYHNGSDPSGYPVASDSVFRNSTGTTAVANGTYKMANNKAMTIDGGSGVVSEINDCE